MPYALVTQAGSPSASTAFLVFQSIEWSFGLCAPKIADLRSHKLKFPASNFCAFNLSNLLYFKRCSKRQNQIIFSSDYILKEYSALRKNNVRIIDEVVHKDMYNDITGVTQMAK